MLIILKGEDYVKSISLFVAVLFCCASTSIMSMNAFKKIEEQRKKDAQHQKDAQIKDAVRTAKARMQNNQPVRGSTMSHLPLQPKIQAWQHNHDLANRQSKKK